MTDIPRTVLPAALPADARAARQSCSRRASGRRARRSRASSSSPRASASRRARCARRSTRSPRQPARAPAGQGHVRRDAHRGEAVALPLPAHPPRRRRRRISGEPPDRRAPRQGERRGRARCSTCAAGDAVLLLRRLLTFAGVPAVLDDIALPAALFRGLTKARYDAYRGSIYGFFETEFGVRMLKARERAQGGGGRCGERRAARRRRRRAAAGGRTRHVHVRRSAGRIAPRPVRDRALSLPERAADDAPRRRCATRAMLRRASSAGLARSAPSRYNFVLRTKTACEELRRT